MSTKVHKFPLELRLGEQVITMPDESLVVHVAVQNIGGVPCPVMWAQVRDPSLFVEDRRFHLFTTGDEIDLPSFYYIGTVHIEWTVWHIYEAKG